MRAAPLLVSTLLAFTFLGGCSTPPAEPQPGQTRHFELVVGSGTSDTIEVYELGNGQRARIVAVPFKESEEEPPRVPGPLIRVKEGDTVILTVRNNNPLPHTLHLHGGLVPWEEDGVDFLTQMPIEQGTTHTYTFRDLKAGTYWYHCHLDGAHHIDLGMYGAFIVEERDPPRPAHREYTLLLDEMDNCHVHGNAEPVDPRTSERSGSPFQANACAQRVLQDWLAQNQAAQSTGRAASPYTQSTICPTLEPQPGDPPEAASAKAQARAALGCDAHAHPSPPQQPPRSWWPETMPAYAPLYNTFVINGKAFPDTEVLAVKPGETVRLRLINAGNQWHAFHLHGHPLEVAYRDGYPLGAAAFRADTLSIGPGERYDVFVEANNPGWWMMHDQNGLATMNDDVHPGGMMGCLAYDGFKGVSAFAMERALDCNTAAMRFLGHDGH